MADEVVPPPAGEGAQPAAEDGSVDPEAADPAPTEADVTEEVYAEEDVYGEDTGEADGAAGGPTGEGWVIQLNGYHFHNINPRTEGQRFVEDTLIESLENGTVMLPDGPNGEMVEVSMDELGISHPVVITPNPIYPVEYSPDATSETGLRRGRTAAAATGRPTSRTGGRRNPRQEVEEVEEPVIWKLREYDFVVQFAWVPTPRSERIAKRAGGEGSTEQSDDEFDSALRTNPTRR
jgi:type IV pilus assembly protein PilM